MRDVSMRNILQLEMFLSLVCYFKKSLNLHFYKEGDCMFKSQIQTSQVHNLVYVWCDLTIFWICFPFFFL